MPLVPGQTPNIVITGTLVGSPAPRPGTLVVSVFEPQMIA
jgi:hypothetical protein